LLNNVENSGILVVSNEKKNGLHFIKWHERHLRKVRYFLLITWKTWEKKVRCFLFNNVENLRKTVGYSLLIMKKTWGYFQLDSTKILREIVGFFLLTTERTWGKNNNIFLLITWKTWGKIVEYVEPQVV
jgi:hypothetical protein